MKNLSIRLRLTGWYCAVLLAGLENHLVFINPGRLGYTSQPMDSTYRPSIDVFFKSVESTWRGDVIGVLLTGMGSDGAGGLKALHNAGHHTIVQDRATSAVYGMPKAAAEMKAPKKRTQKKTRSLPIRLVSTLVIDVRVLRDQV